MPDSEHETEATVSRDGVTVYQTFTTEEFGVPTVALKLVSDRSGPVRVGLRVDLPASLDIEKIGFHPEYREDGWTVGDGEITFEADLDPESELTTMYAIDSPTSEQQTALLDSLSVERVEPVTPDEVDTSTLVELDEDDVKTLDPGAGPEDTSSPASPEAESGDETTGSAGAPPSTTDPSAEPDERSESGDQWGESPESGATDPPTDEGSETGGDPAETAGGESVKRDDPPDLSAYSAEALVAELDRRASADDLPEETRERIDGLASDRADAAELDARLSHLQKRMSDMEAYTDPVRDLHEEHGHPVEVVDRLERRLAEFGDRLDSIDERLAAVDESVADIEPRFEEVAADVESVRSDVATVKADVESVETEQERMASKLSSLSEWRDSVTSALDALGGK
ncbi:MAG: hypothetical protein ABEH61_02025 [Haloarculaceae archaeon]